MQNNTVFGLTPRKFYAKIRHNVIHGASKPKLRGNTVTLYYILLSLIG